ncbi:hypothetical protein ACFIJ5_07655 [Haloimpatiens sp. FM7330]
MLFSNKDEISMARTVKRYLQEEYVVYSDNIKNPEKKLRNKI